MPPVEIFVPKAYKKGRKFVLGPDLKYFFDNVE